MILQTEVSVGLPSMLPSEAMVAAACDGNIQAMQTMVTKHGPDILSTRTTTEGWTPALGAARNGRYDALQFLVTHTIRYQITNGLTRLFTATTSSGGTAAHLAARGGWTDVLTFLVDHLGKAALTVRDNDGWLPAHSAARGGHIDVLRLIASHTSTRAVLDEQGSGATLKSIARKYGQKEVGKLIEEFSGQVPVRILAETSSKPTSCRPSRAQSPPHEVADSFLSRLAEAELRDSALPLNPRPRDLLHGLPVGATRATPTGSPN